MTTLLGQKFREATDAEQRAATAAYIATMTGDLAELARRHGLDALGYLLDMARLEAETQPRVTKSVRRAG
jgi:hypothetical protein